MNRDELSGMWKQVRGKAREKWGKLTNDDLDVINGQSEQLVGKIQQHYGMAIEDARKAVDAWLDAMGDSVKDAKREFHRSR